LSLSLPKFNPTVPLSRSRWTATVAGLALALAGQVMVRQSLVAILVYCGAIFLFLCGGPPDAEPRAPAVRRLRWDRRWVLPLAVGVSLAMGSLFIWGINHFQGTVSDLTLVAFLVGLVILGFGLRQLGRAETSAARPSSQLAEYLLVAAIIAAGFLFRTYALDDLPYGVWYDEADSALEAVQINSGAHYSPAGLHYRYIPSMYYDVVAIGFRLFGTSVFAIRIVTVFFALLAIPMLYVLARSLFDRRVAMLAASALALSRWHVDFSRFGLSNITTGICAIAALYFLWRALRSNRWSDYAWSGLWFGFGFHTYIAFKLFPIAGFLLLSYALLRKFRAPRVLLPRYLLLVTLAMLAFGPFLVFTLQSPAEANQRVGEASVFAEKPSVADGLLALAGNVEKHFLMFNVRGDENGRHNLPGEPELAPIAGAFFVLGAAFMLRWLRQLRFHLLLVWLIIGLLPGILSLDIEAPQSTRSLIAAPAAALLVALPPALAWNRTRDLLNLVGSVRAHRLGLPLASTFLTLAFVGIAVSEVSTYFGRQANDLAVWLSFSTQETIAAREAQRLGPGFHYVLPREYGERATMRFLVPWLTDHSSPSGVSPQSPPEVVERPTVLFWGPDQTDTIEQLKARFPAGQFREHRPPFGGRVVLYEAVLYPEATRGHGDRDGP
jgi:4-amino-4-deoxy-L-arabinose transferase-like glycosyltransferase